MARNFERHLEQRLNTELDGALASKYMSAYTQAKHKLTTQIYDEVKGVQPALSDHSDRHIDNVLKNCGRLISLIHETHNLTSVDLYCLAMIVLFHDVGNLFGRDDHQKKVGEIFDWVRGTTSDLRHERTLVLKAARAHRGEAGDGSSDTLKELNEYDHLEDHQVKLRELAAILRFADELAEGPQRTSDFMRMRGAFSPGSAVYHDYSSITNVHIDRGGGRIMLTYEVDIASRSIEDDAWLRSLLEFSYKRVIKLNQERRYARFYAPCLSPFRITSVEVNFHSGTALLPVSLPPIQLDDKTIPGDPCKSIPELVADYDIDSVLRQVHRATDGSATS